MDLQLTDKCALVTGGIRGIGRAVARQLALEGARVAITSRKLQDAEEAAKILSDECGAEVVGLQVDTGDDASVRAMMAAFVERFGRLDIVVNAAAKPGTAPKIAGIAGVEDQEFWEDVNVKVLGYIRVCRAAAPHLTANGWGRIINVSGMAARNAVSIIGSIRNVAVSAMTKNLADELGPKGVNVTVIHPGLTRTEKTGPRMQEIAERQNSTAEEVEQRLSANSSIRRIVDASEVADVVAFLASPRSSSITGDAIACGGGVVGAIYY